MDVVYKEVLVSLVILSAQIWWGEHTMFGALCKWHEFRFCKILITSSLCISENDTSLQQKLFLSLERLVCLDIFCKALNGSCCCYKWYNKASPAEHFKPYPSKWILWYFCLCNVHFNWKIHCQRIEGCSSNQSQDFVEERKDHGDYWCDYNICCSPHQSEEVNVVTTTEWHIKTMFCVYKLALRPPAAASRFNKAKNRLSENLYQITSH